MLFSVVPNCRAYDPAFAYEVAVIVHEGLRRMCAEQEDVFYYLTLMNENYHHPALPDGAAEGILRGMHRLPEGEPGDAQVQLLGSGTILGEVRAAARAARARTTASGRPCGASPRSPSSAATGSTPSAGTSCTRRLRPGRAYVTEQLGSIPTVAATDYVRTLPDLIRQWVPGPYRTLGTDGFGRSDRRAALRDFFEVDRRWVALAALRELAAAGSLDPGVVAEAMRRFEIDPETPPPVSR